MTYFRQSSQSYLSTPRSRFFRQYRLAPTHQHLPHQALFGRTSQPLFGIQRFYQQSRFQSSLQQQRPYRSEQKLLPSPLRPRGPIFLRLWQDLWYAANRPLLQNRHRFLSGLSLRPSYLRLLRRAALLPLML